jgi:hypothetical protein
MTIPKLNTTSAKDLADKVKVEPEKVVPKPVEVKPVPSIEIYVDLSKFEVFWNWLFGYAKQQVANSTEGRPVDNPLAPFSFVASLTANWWKWLAILVVLAGIVYALTR